MTSKKLITVGTVVVGIVVGIFCIQGIYSTYRRRTPVPANPQMRKPVDGKVNGGNILSYHGTASTKDMESIIKKLSDMMEPPKETSGKDGARGEPEWVEYESSEGGFSVLLPNTPARSILGRNTQSIQTSFTSVSGDFRYTVVYEEIEGGIQDANAILDAAASPMGGIKQLSRSNLSVNGLPGREVLSEITGSGWMLKRRWFVANGGSYFLSAQFPKREFSANMADVDRFLDSFKVLGKESDE